MAQPVRNGSQVVFSAQVQRPSWALPVGVSGMSVQGPGVPIAGARVVQINSEPLVTRLSERDETTRRAALRELLREIDQVDLGIPRAVAMLQDIGDVWVGAVLISSPEEDLVFKRGLMGAYAAALGRVVELCVRQGSNVDPNMLAEIDNHIEQFQRYQRALEKKLNTPYFPLTYYIERMLAAREILGLDAAELELKVVRKQMLAALQQNPAQVVELVRGKGGWLWYPALLLLGKLKSNPQEFVRFVMSDAEVGREYGAMWLFAVVDALTELAVDSGSPQLVQTLVSYCQARASDPGSRYAAVHALRTLQQVPALKDVATNALRSVAQNPDPLTAPLLSFPDAFFALLPPEQRHHSVPPVIQPAAPAIRSVRKTQLPRIVDNPLIKMKLANPNLELTPDDSITLLTQCIQYGKHQAQKAHNKNAVIFLGNTGAGKSTTVNYLYGCEMERRAPEDLDISGLDDDVVVVKQNSKLAEVMPIGHTKVSTTFMPQIETESETGITYCDCPGFLDNRGAEINIANAVNIKNAIQQASSVKVIMLINFFTLKVDRGRGLTDMLKIACNLFGLTDNLIRYKDSILIGITNPSPKMTLERLKAFVADSNLPIMKTLAERIFTFDPLDEPITGGMKREQILKAVDALVPIDEPSKIFTTVLTAEDERKLFSISEKIGTYLQDALRAANYPKAAHHYAQLQNLSIIEHIVIDRLLNNNRRKIEQQFQDTISSFKDHCNFERFSQAQTLLEQLQGALKFFDHEFQQLIDLSKLRDYYAACEDKYRRNQQKERELQEQLQKARDQIDQFVALLEEQKRFTQEKLELQKAHFQQIIAEMEKTFQKRLQDYDNMKVALGEEMEKRLAQKAQEIAAVMGQNQQAIDQKISQERAKLQKEYAAQAAALEQEKQQFMREQEAQRRKQAQEAAAEQAKLQEHIQKLAAEQADKLAAAAAAKAPVIPEIAFGKAKWAKYFGDIGTEPPLPPDINQILESPCPFWPGRKIKDTHMLVLVPQTVNGKPINMKLLGELVQKPLQGNATKYEYLYLGQYTDPSAPASHWVLMTRDVFEGSRSKPYTEQQQLVVTNAQKAKAPYEVPKLLDATVAIFMEYIATGTRLYSDSPYTYTRCQEKYDANWQLAVGGFAPAGLYVDYDFAYESLGVAGVRKFC